MTNFIFFFGVIMFSIFWVFLIVKIMLMKRMGASALTFSPKQKLKNRIFTVVFFSTLLAITCAFLINSSLSIDFLMFNYFWNPFELIWLSILGIILGITAQLILYIAIYTMGSSWRIGIDDKNPDDLITSGIFSISRNPIFFGMDLTLISLFILQPNLFFIVIALGVVIGDHIQILKEEKHLLETYGNNYAEYKKKTKRYFLFF